MTQDEQLAALSAIAAASPGLCLLVLFGSRARERAHDRSDWDFGYLADAGFDSESLHRALVVELRSERVDLVNLATASALLRYRAAAQARVIFERAGEFRRFWLDAVGFWCDAEPVLRGGYDRVLERLGV